ncbi:MAG: hypothetical protein AAGN46_01995 [Acidobacteriota bacterium]
MNLWFVNDSSNAGQVIVAQSFSNLGSGTTGGNSQLAWLQTGANQGVSVNFQWSIDDDFVWFASQGATSSQQVLATSSTEDVVTLSFDSRGFKFQQVTDVSREATSLQVQQDGSIPNPSNCRVGIGMSGAGTFAQAAQPNIDLAFEVVSTANYAIAFGNWTVATNDTLPAVVVDSLTEFTFATGYTTMTATLSTQNTFTITPGPPPESAAESKRPTVVYRAGVGVVSSS